jgi:ubiquinone biosynthesis protein
MLLSSLPLDICRLAELVPECYAAFRDIVSDGIAFFVSRLSPTRLEEIITAQSALPVDAGVRQRLAQLLHASPVLHKIGQVVARRRELDPALRRELQRLESMEPRTPIEQLQPLIDRELKPFAQHYRIELGTSALAEASVASVLPVRWSDPSSSQQREGVLKVLKPGVRQKLGEDVEILAGLADFLDQRAGESNLPPLAYREILDDVRELLENEIRLDQEQAHLRRAGRQYADDPGVRVPALLPFSTDHLTALERIRGTKVTDLARRGPLHDMRLFSTIVRALLADVMFTRDESALFHGDPHAGNLFAIDDHCLAPLDWSLAGTLSNAQREELAQLELAAASLNESRMLRSLDRLSSWPFHPADARRRVRAALAQIAFRRLPDLRWLMHLLDDLALAGVRFPPNLMVFRKSFFTLEGVLTDVCPEADIADALTGTMLRRLWFEWPLRWLKTPTSRDYDTQLSTADLLGLGIADRGFRESA